MFELIEKYYRMGIYTDAQLALFVQSGTITAAQVQQIKEKDSRPAAESGAR